MKIFKTFFILICITVFNSTFCCNYTFCSELIKGRGNDLKNLRNTGKFTNKYIETSLKRYAVYQYKKHKILCEPYRVSKDDWLYKIFRKKGEISEKDFPLFINIFKTVNPKINNIDAILPGQIILIPLKNIHKNDFKETSPGVVDVPMIEFTSIPEALKPFIKKHLVKKGETLSQLLDSMFLNKDGTINARGMKALKLYNPDIKDVNLIYAGSLLNIPSASLNSQSWFQASLHVPNKDIKAGNTNKTDKKTIKTKQNKTIIKKTTGKIKYNYTLSQVLKNYASVVGGKLIHTGRFYFPQKNKPDIVLDLKSHPVIELANGGKVLIFPDLKNSGELSQTIGEFWKDLKIITLAEAVDNLNRIKPENNINQFKEENIEILPFGHEAALKKILSFTRFQYIPNSQVSLSFNSISVNVNLGKVRSKGRPDILVDFGTIYGYALDIIRKKGLHIISFPPKNEFITSLSKLFDGLGMSVTMNPVFVSLKTNKEITINGLYVAGDISEMHIDGLLITDHKLAEETILFLNQKNIKILLYTEYKIK